MMPITLFTRGRRHEAMLEELVAEHTEELYAE